MDQPAMNAFTSRNWTAVAEIKSVATLGDHHFVVQPLATPEFVRNTRVRGILEERRGLLDANRVRDVLSRLEAALGQSDLLPVFEREWARDR